MLRIAVPTLLTLSIIGCSTKDEDVEDSGGFGSGAWSGGGANDLPPWGSGGGSTGGSGAGDGSTTTGSGSGGGSGTTSGGTSGGGSGSTSGGTSGGGSGTTGGGTSGGGSGGDGVARDYAGGYITNRCATTPTPTGTNVGDISPDWELTDQYGERVRLSDFCGSLVLLESAGFS